jgi:UDP-glucuronate 4-epimerase|tara:strand:+ start:422 stop:1435 length:1014 start_codon:yes stop_codon:yes gene_type:complete
MKKNIFITGSAGFIGFSLAKSLLDRGHHIHGYDGMTKYYDVRLKRERNKILKTYKNFSFTKAMLENEKTLKKVITKFKPKIIIHLAAQPGVRYSIEKPRTYLSSNITGTFNIIEAAHKAKVNHLIVASSSSVYGANKSIPYSETDKTQTQLSVYAATKRATESIAHAYSNLWKLPTTMLRFFTVYGPWGRPDMALFKFTESIIKGNPIDIYNNGKMYRDFTYIDDIVKSTISLIDVPPKNEKNIDKNDSLSPVAPFRIVNIGNSNKVKLLDFVDTLETCLGKKAIRNYMPMQKGDVYATWANTDLLKKLTGYSSTTDFKEGIKKFVDWYTNHYKQIL